MNVNSFDPVPKFARLGWSHLDPAGVEAGHGHGDGLELGVPDAVALDGRAALRHHHDQAARLAPHRALADLLHLHVQVLHTLA